MQREIPERYVALITPLIDTARGILEQGGSLPQQAFVGSSDPRTILRVAIDTSSVAAKNFSARAVRAAASHVQADFVFTVMEAWGLPPDKAPMGDEIVEKYGSIGESPYRVDIVSLVLETTEGVWGCTAPIRPKGASSKRRTFGQVTFLFASEARGRFLGVLPGAPGEGSLH